MRIFIFLMLLIASTTLNALSPEPRLANESDEQRAQVLFTKVKCPVCGGQTIDSSSSEFSYKLRALIRQQIKNKNNDKDIERYLIDQFGEEIMLSGRLKGNTYLFWTLLIISVGTLFAIIRTKKWKFKI